jgi:hypothetical protein
VSADDDRLAALERALVGAAAVQALRLRRRRRRVVVLGAATAPLVLAAAGSVAATGLFSAGVDRHLAPLRDDRLRVRPAAVASVQSSAGEQPRDAAGNRAWTVAGRRVVGFTSRSGHFCFEFVGFTGGCVAPGQLTPEHPVAVSSDNQPGEFRVYGLAADEVTSLTLRARGVTRRVPLGRNAFFLDAPALGTRHGFSGTLVARLRDGTTRTVPISVGGFIPAERLPALPGSLPVENAAA